MNKKGNKSSTLDLQDFSIAPLPPYALKNNDGLLRTSDSGRPYILKVRDLAENDKPREKLVAQGPGALSTAELIAVILNTGTVKEDVLSMSEKIVKEYGEKSLISFADPKKVALEFDIPIGKACQLVATSELGRRFYKRAPGKNHTVRNAGEVFEYARDMRDLGKEHLRGLYLNAHHQVIHDEIVSIGTIDANLIHPREVFKPAIDRGAVAVILVHNHPSGVATPSAADIEITNQLIEAGRILGINLVDHVIVAAEGFISIPANYE